MKKKIKKIIFIVSFLPYILILVCATINTIFGSTFMTSETYGFDAFVLTVVVMIWLVMFKVPLIPCCIIYQFYYMFTTKNKKQ